MIQSIISTTLKRGQIAITVRDGETVTRDLTLDMSGISIDQLTRGQFFTAIGFEPSRPKLAPIIGRLESNAPAERAGFKEGDLVVRADGEAIPDWVRWVDYVRAHPKQAMDVTVERSGETLVIPLVPDEVEDGDRRVGRIGAGVKAQPEIMADYYTLVRYGPIESIPRSFIKTSDTTLLTLRMFWKMLKLEVSLKNLSGPISIAQYAGYTAKVGVSKFIEFLAIVSISLGILNLLPIPVLDGGHLMYNFVELLKGRPVSEEAQYLGQRFGIAMLFGLMGLAFYNDLARLFG